MRKIYFIILLLLTIKTTQAQTYFQQAKSTLSLKTSQYNTAYDKLSQQYSFLMNLQLVNKKNIEVLSNYRKKIKEWADTNFSKIDLSLDQNVVGVSNFFTQWQKVATIKTECKTLDNIDAELARIKMKDPDGFYKSDRYVEIQGVLKELEDCQPGDINAIAWKHGFAN